MATVREILSRTRRRLDAATGVDWAGLVSKVARPYARRLLNRFELIELPRSKNTSYAHVRGVDYYGPDRLGMYSSMKTFGSIVE